MSSHNPVLKLCIPMSRRRGARGRYRGGGQGNAIGLAVVLLAAIGTGVAQLFTKKPVETLSVTSVPMIIPPPRVNMPSAVGARFVRDPSENTICTECGSPVTTSMAYCQICGGDLISSLRQHGQPSDVLDGMRQQQDTVGLLGAPPFISRSHGPWSRRLVICGGIVGVLAGGFAVLPGTGGTPNIGVPVAANLTTNTRISTVVEPSRVAPTAVVSMPAVALSTQVQASQQPLPAVPSPSIGPALTDTAKPSLTITKAEGADFSIHATGFRPGENLIVKMTTYDGDVCVANESDPSCFWNRQANINGTYDRITPLDIVSTKGKYWYWVQGTQSGETNHVVVDLVPFAIASPMAATTTTVVVAHVPATVTPVHVMSQADQERLRTMLVEMVDRYEQLLTDGQHILREKTYASNDEYSKALSNPASPAARFASHRNAIASVRGVYLKIDPLMLNITNPQAEDARNHFLDDLRESSEDIYRWSVSALAFQAVIGDESTMNAFEARFRRHADDARSLIGTILPG